MNEPLERISHLERSVRRWRAVSLCLLLLLILVLVGGGIYAFIPPTQEAGDFLLFLPWVRAARERAAREDLIRAKLQTERAFRAMEAEKRAVEAKRAEDAANNEP